MAVENVNNALTKFEADKNLFDQLDAREKEDLKKVTKDDCVKEISKIGSKKIGDKTLKELVDSKSISYNTRTVNGRTVFDCYIKVNGQKQKIGNGSDLGALIQMYILAKGSNVGTTGIDGWIGEKTIRGGEATGVIKNPNTSTNTGKTAPEVDTYQGEKLGMRDIKNHVFTEDFNAIKKDCFKSYADKKVFTQSGYLQSTVTIGEAQRANRKFSLTYTGRHDKVKTVEVALNIKDNKVNSMELAKSIKKAVDTKEDADLAEERRVSIVNGINKYKETSIKDNLIKQYFTHAKTELSYGQNNKGIITVHNKVGSDLSINKADIVDKNGWFNEGKYASVLVSKFKNDAISYARGELSKAHNKAGTYSATGDKINGYQAVIDQVKGYGSKYESTFANEKNNAIKQKNYRESVKAVDSASYEIGRTSDFDTRLKKLSNIITIEKPKNTADTYKVYYNNQTRDAYEAVGKKSDYTTRLSALVKKVLDHGYVEYNK